MLRNFTTVLLTAATLLCSSTSNAEGEAGILSLRAQGNFYVGLDITHSKENGGVKVSKQMYVGYQLPAEQQHPYPVILVHGGGGQSSYWFSTPDERDGWRDYLLADGFDVYWVDRPGYGRSPTNTEYGELTQGSNSKIVSFFANSENWPGNPQDPNDPAILAILASSQPGPYGGDIIAAQALSELLERIGPAILLTHSAGSISAWWAADLNPDKVAGIIAIEPGASNITSFLRAGLTYSPALPEDFSPKKDEEDCALQGSATPSRLKHFSKIKIHLVGSELGLIAGLPCAVKAFTEAGVNVHYTYLPDAGLTGNGHFMMSETNNGELAEVIIRLAEDFETHASPPLQNK